MVLLSVTRAPAAEGLPTWPLVRGGCVTGRLAEAHAKVVVIERGDGVRVTLARSQLGAEARARLAEGDEAEQARLERERLPAGLGAEAQHLKAQADRLRALYEAGRVDMAGHQAQRAALQQRFWNRYEALLGTNATPETAQAASNLLSAAGL